jgi:hypothetical protein
MCVLRGCLCVHVCSRKCECVWVRVGVCVTVSERLCVCYVCGCVLTNCEDGSTSAATAAAVMAAELAYNLDESSVGDELVEKSPP